jgi:ABC-type phosphate transport system auxiliary subunit
MPIQSTGIQRFACACAYVWLQAETLFVLFELRSLSSVIAKSGHTFFLPSPIARSVSVAIAGSGSIAHASVSNLVT